MFFSENCKIFKDEFFFSSSWAEVHSHCSSKYSPEVIEAFRLTFFFTVRQRQKQRPYTADAKVTGLLQSRT